MSEVPGLQVKPDRKGLPIWGTQHEPYYDKDLFVPLDYQNAEGTMCVRACLASLRNVPHSVVVVSLRVPLSLCLGGSNT